ncbi:MAG: CHAP domain-containing protein [Myxococcota bacterium]|nr:CHAP domain-containing protein [Myxococcota bacterium]
MLSIARARVVPFWLALAAAGSVSAQPCRPHRPCEGVTCGGRGECVTEQQDELCFCEEGFEAVGRTCVQAPPAAWPDRSPAAGARIVALASAERGRDLASVGVTRARYPGPLSLDVRPGGLWCSDFVSWVYRAAGVPFTGGSEGGWLLPTNLAIRRWFERRGWWVSKEGPGWSRFEPRPGDYVRLRTRTWGHSAIVRAVEGDTLHVIEGNAGGRVRLTSYPHYRTHDRIDGFGLPTTPGDRIDAVSR